MTTKRKVPRKRAPSNDNAVTRKPEPRVRRAQLQARQIVREVGSAHTAGADWRMTSGLVQAAELALDALRFQIIRAALGKRPDRHAMSARAMARRFVEWADELDDPATNGPRRRRLEADLQIVLQACTRAAAGHHGGSDDTLNRTLLDARIQKVADWARTGAWLGVPALDPLDHRMSTERWKALADVVIKSFLPHPLANRLKANRSLVQDAVCACSTNRGGRGKRVELSKDDALKRLCQAVGLPVVERESLRRAKSRARPKPG